MRPPFQFTLRQTLCVTALTSLGLLLLGPLLMPQPRYLWPEGLEYDTQACLSWGLLIVAVTLAGAFFGLWRAHRRGMGRGAQYVFLIGYTFGAWACLAVIFVVAMPRRFGPGFENIAWHSCNTYKEAQEIYHRKDWDGDGVLEYAQSLRELFEPQPGSGIHYIDPRFADAEVVNGRAIAKAGYVFKILKVQGTSVTGGAKSYLTTAPNGEQNMTEGYALVACPVRYNESGRDCFMINHHGTIFEADLGPDTPKIFEAMTEFNLAFPPWLPTE